MSSSRRAPRDSRAPTSAWCRCVTWSTCST